MFQYPWGDFHSLNLGWFLIQFKTWVEKIQEYLDNGGGTSENLANVIAPVFNAENSYLTGDYVLYNDELYKANQAVNPGTWNPDAWTRCLVTEEMGSGSGGVDNVARLMIAGQYSNTYNYQKYAICRYNDKLWMCNTNLPAGGEEWEPSHWDEITVGAGLTGLRRSADTLAQAISDEADAREELEGFLNTVENSIAFIIRGNRLQGSTAVVTGQYVLLMESTITGKPDGLYTASKAIPINTDIDETYLTAVSNGGLNKLNKQWTLYGTYTGIQNTNLMPPDSTFPEGTEEVCVVCKNNGVSLILTMADLKRSGAEYRQAGFYIAADNNGGFAFQIRSATQTFGYCTTRSNGEVIAGDFEVFIR